MKSDAEDATQVPADEAFQAALELHEHDPSEFERARTRLAHGERLRRVRQRRRVRDHLHAALQSFEGIGARPWADRAGAELRASGERVRRRGAAAHERLTPQELQVSLAAVHDDRSSLARGERRRRSAMERDPL